MSSSGLEIEKTFDATIDVPNPIQFSIDSQRNLLSELHNLFSGRCYKGALITRIVRIDSASACHIVATNGSGEGYVDVQFTAAVKVFSKWDILSGVVIRHISHLVAGHYAPAGGNTAQAFVVLHPTPGVATLTVGQQIPVRVTKSEHPARRPAVVYAALLTCDRTAPVYRVRGALDAAAGAELAPMLARIEAELQLRAELAAERSANLSAAEALLYAYKSGAHSAVALSDSVAAWADGPSWAGPPQLRALDPAASAVSVLDLARRAATSAAPVPVSGLWSRDLCIYRSSPLAAHIADRSQALPADWGAPLDEPPRVVFALMLKNVLDFLVATREIATGYDAPGVSENYAGLWGAMRLAQRPA